MFGWRKPKPPLETFEKAWVEYRMRWLVDRFGLERLRKVVVVLPSDEFFPNEYTGTVEDAHRIMDQLCDHMGVDRSRLTLEIGNAVTLRGFTGLYQAEDGAGPNTIFVLDSMLEDPEELIAVLAHEISHEVLLAGGHLTVDEGDHEWVTDLLPVYFGLGIFSANAVMRDKSETLVGVETWSVRGGGYLPARMYGYALALFSWLREESAPPWSRCLRLDAAAVYQRALGYLDRADDVLVDRDAASRASDRRNPAELRRQLREGSPSARIAAMWDVGKLGITEASILGEVADCLQHRDPAIRAEAARTMSTLQIMADGAAPKLVTNLRDGVDYVRANAAHALGILRVDTDGIIDELAVLLDDHEADVAYEAAWALANYGQQADSCTRYVMPALRKWLVECQHGIVEGLIATLNNIAEDPEAMINTNFAEDEDLRGAALHALENAAPR